MQLFFTYAYISTLQLWVRAILDLRELRNRGDDDSHFSKQAMVVVVSFYTLYYSPLVRTTEVPIGTVESTCRPTLH